MSELITSPHFDAIELRGFSAGFDVARFGEAVCDRHTRIFADYAFLHEAHPDPAQRQPIPEAIQAQLLQWLDEGSVDPWACYWTPLLKHEERQRPLIGFSIGKHFSPDTPFLMDVAQYHFDWHHPEYRRYWMDEPWSAASEYSNDKLVRMFCHTDFSPDDCFTYHGEMPLSSHELLEQSKTWAIDVKQYLHEHYPDLDQPSAMEALKEQRGKRMGEMDTFKKGWHTIIRYGGMFPAMYFNHPTYAPLVAKANAHTARVIGGLLARAQRQPIPPDAIAPETLSQATLFPLANIGRLGDAFHPILWEGREAEALTLIESLPLCMRAKLAPERAQFLALFSPPWLIESCEHEGQLMAQARRERR